MGAWALLSVSGCASQEKAGSSIAPDKVAAVQIGRSTRTDVFATLGRPVRTERSNAGERWIYEAAPQGKGNKQALSSSMGAATSVAGAFIPFVGLAGPGMSLVNAASPPPPPDGAPASLSVDFDDEGIVRDCVYASSAIPDGLPGAASSEPVGCTRARAAS